MGTYKSNRYEVNSVSGYIVFPMVLEALCHIYHNTDAVYSEFVFSLAPEILYKIGGMSDIKICKVLLMTFRIYSRKNKHESGTFMPILGTEETHGPLLWPTPI